MVIIILFMVRKLVPMAILVCVLGNSVLGNYSIKSTLLILDSFRLITVIITCLVLIDPVARLVIMAATTTEFAKQD